MILPFGRRFSGAAVLMLAASLVAAPLAHAQQRDRRGPPPRPAGQSYANSSAILVEEIALSRAARDEGQWAALAQKAAEDAMMFADQPVLAKPWLKGRSSPAESIRWDAQKLFMACDGRSGASTGATQGANGSVGYYTTVWQNLEKPRAKKPDWRWVLSHQAPLAEPRAGDEMIESRTAVCTGDPKAVLGEIPMGPPPKGSDSVAPQPAGARASADGTMVWRWEARSDGSRAVTIDLWNGSAFETVVSDTVPGTAS
jgi:hypothetical protein